MPTTLLMDGDIFAYRAAIRHQNEIDFGDDDPLIETDLDAAIKDLDTRFRNLKRKLKANDIIVCLSDDENNWRKDVLPSYKEHRKDSVRPLLLYQLKDYLYENYSSYRKPLLEADDVMGILSTHPKLIPGKKIIVSADKDMKTIPGWYYNPDKEDPPRLIKEHEADWWHLYQTLIGDTTDGYGGCPMIGDVAARELLENPVRLEPYEHVFKRGKRKGETETRFNKIPTDCLWEMIVSHFEAKGLTEEYALQQARVARICRSTDYNFKKKEVKLWQPELPLIL